MIISHVCSGFQKIWLMVVGIVGAEWLGAFVCPTAVTHGDIHHGSATPHATLGPHARAPLTTGDRGCCGSAATSAIALQQYMSGFLPGLLKHHVLTILC